MANMGKMLREAQRLQQEMAKAQADIAEIARDYDVGGGAVRAVARGDGTLTEIHIRPDVLAEADVEMLEDMVLTAVNGAIGEVHKAAEKRMSSVTGGMNIPGLF
ncbi:MAG: YbaB/EbfC family nucleoid-associated protein [Kiritimatiellaeota bacterium]|nr:YbaB/EbfC family nucleoid-associated protein [Kiritimatiellota bacterium]